MHVSWDIAINLRYNNNNGKPYVIYDELLRRGHKSRKTQITNTKSIKFKLKQDVLRA